LTAAGPGAWTVGRRTLHGGLVRLRSVRATPCFHWYSFNKFASGYVKCLKVMFGIDKFSSVSTMFNCWWN